MTPAEWVIIAFLVGHTCIVLGFAWGVYRAQKAHNTAQSSRIEAAIREIKAEIPDYSAQISAVDAQIRAIKIPDYSAQISAVDAQIRAIKIPDYSAQIAEIERKLPPPVDLDDLEERMSKRLCAAIDGKLGSEVRAVKEAIEFDPNIQQRINDAAGGPGVNVLERVLSRFGI